MTAIRTRGNTFRLSFQFLDENGGPASVASADVQLTYPGYDRKETERLTLTQDGNNWKANWDSTKSRAGWVEIHAHATGTDDTIYTEADRFKISGNDASLQREVLPKSGNAYRDYVVT